MMVVVVVVSNHDATDATREEVLSLSPLHVPSFGLVQVVYVQVFLFFFFRDTAFSPILVAPEIISGDYWGAALDEWRLGDEMYLSVFEGSGSGRRVAGVEFFSSRSMDREILYIFLFFISRIVFRVQNLITNF